jgi:Trp operon repressor
MDYFLSLERVVLPSRVTDEYALLCLQVLVVAELVEATFVQTEVSGKEYAADISAITERGKATLEGYRSGKPVP